MLLASGFCDTLDGVLARNFQQATVFGGFFDSLLDRYADAIVYSGIIIGGLCDVSWGLAALAGSMLVSYAEQGLRRQESRWSLWVWLNALNAC